jgi:hypothetical protein
MRTVGGIVMVLGAVPLLILSASSRGWPRGLLFLFLGAILVLLFLVGATLWTIGYSRSYRR